MGSTQSGSGEDHAAFLVKRLLLLRAAEEADPSGERIPLSARAAAGKAALAGPDHDFLRVRAETLANSLPSGPLRSALSPSEQPEPFWRVWWPRLLPAGALLLGFLSDELGADRKLNLLAFPLLGLILWNLSVCVAALIAGFRKTPVPSRPSSSWDSVLKADTGEAFAAQVRETAASDWRRLEAPALGAKARLVFHLSAILLAAGMVAGMYLKGLGRDYRAAWESTFLDRPAVSKLLRIVLGPGSIVTGIPVPQVPEENQPAPAAPWIHLWAASAGLFILVPRALLVSSALTELRRSRPDMAREFAEWEEKARAFSTGQPMVALVAPVQCAPPPPLRDRLREVLQHLWGGQVIVDFLPSVEYGEEDEFLESLTDIPSHLVMLFPFSATPEAEIHGHLVKELAEKLAGAPQPARALVVLDTSAFDAKMRELQEFERRASERSGAWERILGGALPVLVLNEEARRRPDHAAAGVAAAREPVRLWTRG